MKTLPGALSRIHLALAPERPIFPGTYDLDPPILSDHSWLSELRDPIFRPASQSTRREGLLGRLKAIRHITAAVVVS